MKLALISDIHSNLHYLEKILAAIGREGVDEIYCLGDLIGYYDRPHDVLQCCLANDIKAVRGNHEHYLIGSIGYAPEKEDLYRIREQREELDGEDMEFLKGLPDFMVVTLMGKTLYLTHSLPGNCVGYLRDVGQLDTGFLAGYDYFCFGHTHRPLINYHFGCCLLNPGSVGQPRDYSRKPSYIIVDLEKDSVTLVKVEVDYKAYSTILRERGYNDLTLHALERN
ncbi:metallophosphoesterase [Geobacter sp. SVR]|uniref:metallophosphoesterase family protein n=1 Tax=Geobacter sp. SVR TaxID=2495594 RepID=UPI00143F054B|nr:YfcE family phosphodiesterase [Geobacter sp. SVR]BCS54641.1 metallophosphatase family protein [Geobacter sp. SVR]GCF86851.1 phosphoesterase [Geobacter sp. SVR]